VLLQHLATLAALEQQQQQQQQPQELGGSISGTNVIATLGCNRSAWVAEAGLAAAAATPAARLVGMLSGDTTIWRAKTEEGGEDEADTAALCAPAAARVFAERCGAAAENRQRHSAHAAALTTQLQWLLSGASSSTGSASRALLAAQHAEQLVSGVLAHPLAAAAASLQQQLADAVQLPAADRAFLPLESASAQLLQPYMLSAGLQRDLAAASSSPDLQQLQQQLKEVSSKTSALWDAVQAAVVLRSAAATADEAAANGCATLLELSCWRHQRPEVWLCAPTPALVFVYFYYAVRRFS
jgi:hypothetical protein